ncbi:MAG: hypothetical protein AVDCRST_MAG22-474, partial [uncultured Rubrobacteraceae bacterium]
GTVGLGGAGNLHLSSSPGRRARNLQPVPLHYLPAWSTGETATKRLFL